MILTSLAYFDILLVPMEYRSAVRFTFSKTTTAKNALRDTLTQPMMSTAVSRVVIHHTEPGVRVCVTVPRRIVTTSTDVL
uniref:Uncharacterized protein n=1 Tax=Magallana gigas TaxID=29159 RepID=A0A8W8KL09_MAGGI